MHHRCLFIVIPAKAGIHSAALRCWTMGPGFRRDDDCEGGASIRGVSPLALLTLTFPLLRSGSLPLPRAGEGLVHAQTRHLSQQGAALSAALAAGRRHGGVFLLAGRPGDLPIDA